jgi:putative endonuclease|tara:strand:- start:32 stop:559 length:528 start_codon:yes stop_codon:yes gene_type:complete
MTNNFDRLKELKPKLNVEKTLRDIKSILKRPHKVYGHGVVSHKEMEKVTKRLDKIEQDLLDIKDHLGLLSATDRLNMMDKEKIKVDPFINKPMVAEWSVYQLECSDRSIYTGICKGDINRRMREHQDGKGSKYVRSRLPFELKWSKSGFTASEALKEEYRIKSLTPEEKRKLWET